MPATSNQSQPPAVAASFSALEAFDAGARFNHLFFLLQQIWLFHAPQMAAGARQLASKLWLGVRGLVSQADKDAVQDSVQRPVLNLLACSGGEDLAEEIVGINDQLEKEYPNGDPIGERANLLAQVFNEFERIRDLILAKLPVDCIPLFRLGEIIDQGVCRPDIFKFLYEEPTDGNTKPKNLLANRIRSVGEIPPDDEWFDQVKAIWGEAGFAAEKLPKEIQCWPAKAVPLNKRSGVVTALEKAARAELERRRLSTLRPVWDAEKRELSFDGQVVKHFANPAANQTKVLDAFQEDAWADVTDDPLDPGTARDTVHDLNKSFKDTPIVFTQDSRKGTIGWRLRDPG